MSLELKLTARNLIKANKKSTGNTGDAEHLAYCFELLQQVLNNGAHTVDRGEGGDLDPSYLEPGSRYRVFSPLTLGTFIGPGADRQHPSFIFQRQGDDPIIYKPQANERWERVR